MIRDGRLFLFHNPKSGGTSIDSAFRINFSPEDRCPLIENTQSDHERLRGDYSLFRGYRYYSGHYGYDVFCDVGQPLVPVTNFRRSVGRIVSLYNFFRLHVVLPDDERSRAELHHVVLAQSVGLLDFVSSQDPRVEVYTRNHHARQLTRTAWDPDCDGDLGHAKALIDTMPWFYVCEEPQASRNWARDVFEDVSLSIPRLNQTVQERHGQRAVTDVDHQVASIIEKKNWLDDRLHAHAEGRLMGSLNQACADLA